TTYFLDQSSGSIIYFLEPCFMLASKLLTHIMPEFLFKFSIITHTISLCMNMLIKGLIWIIDLFMPYVNQWFSRLFIKAYLQVSIMEKILFNYIRNFGNIFHNITFNIHMIQFFITIH